MTAADDCLARLCTAGWSVGEAYFATAAGPVGQVDGRKGETVILARAATQTAA
jgi:hypothetical protein